MLPFSSTAAAGYPTTILPKTFVCLSITYQKSYTSTPSHIQILDDLPLGRRGAPYYLQYVTDVKNMMMKNLRLRFCGENENETNLKVVWNTPSLK